MKRKRGDARASEGPITNDRAARSRTKVDASTGPRKVMTRKLVSVKTFPPAPEGRILRSAEVKPIKTVKPIKARAQQSAPAPVSAAESVKVVKVVPVTTKKNPVRRPKGVSKRLISGSEPAASTKITSGSGLRHVNSVEVGGNTYRVGEDAYVVVDLEAFAQSGGMEEEDEPCEICASAVQSAESPLLECDRCLRGYHTDCLNLPLEDIPEGEWLCPGCASGQPLPPPRECACTLRERFLGGAAGLELIRIRALVQDSRVHPAIIACRVQWYDRPEATHCGRQERHGAREVFLTEQLDEIEGASLQRPASVLPLHEFRSASGGAAGDDVYLCEYDYHSSFQRFRRLGDAPSDVDDDDEPKDRDYAQEGEAEEAESDDGSGTGDESEEEMKAPVVKKRGVGRPPGSKNRAAKGKLDSKPGATNRKLGRMQGGGDWALGKRDYQALGAGEIPATARQQDGSAAGRARAALSLTALPKQLPCRDEERKQIAEFLEDALGGGKQSENLGKCMYISGVPGTGKTATVMELIRNARRRADAGKLPPFQFVEINGLRLASPYHAYSHLYEAMTGCRASPFNAENLLDEMFATGGKQRGKGATTVLLVDEMDLLLTRTQRVLYNLMEWPLRKGSRLAVIGIANTMDLPERFLPRICSRLGSRYRVVFKPYTRQQLSEIVTARLEGLDVFEPNAIKFAAAKVSAVSGDVRRSLELCRRAAEMAETEHRRAKEAGEEVPAELRVKVAHVNAAVEETFESLHMQMMASAPRLEKFLLAALLLETRFTGLQEARMEQVANRVIEMCISHREPKPLIFQCVSAAASLGAKRIILAEPAKRRLCMRLTLNVATDDVRQVLQSESGVSWMQSLNLC